MKYLHEHQAKVQVLGSTVNKEVTFKPKTNRLNSEMQKKVEDLRKNYNLSKEHSKSPLKERNKELAKRDVAANRAKVKEFLERNNQAAALKDANLQKLREEAEEAQAAAMQPVDYRSNRVTSALLHESEKYRDKDLWERQKLFMEEREKKIEQLKKVKEEEDAQGDFKFIKETNKKNLNSKRESRVDQSAKTAQTDYRQSADRTQIHSGFKNTPNDGDRSLTPDHSPDPQRDYSSVFINLDPEGFKSILFKLKAEDDLEDAAAQEENPRPVEAKPEAEGA